MVSIKVMSCSFRDLDKEKWGLLENEAQQLGVFQTYLWAEVLNSMGVKPRSLLVTVNGDPVLGLIMFKSKFISDIFCGYEAREGPLAISAVNPDVFPLFLSALKNILRKQKALHFYWSVPSLANLETHLLGQGFLAVPAATFIVDLAPSLESIWKRFNKKARWGVRKAQKEEVTVSEARDWEDWEIYHRMNVHDKIQKGVRAHSLGLHKSIYTRLLPEEKAKLFLANHRGKVIAGALFLVTPHEMIYYEAASNMRYLDLQPNDIIQWHAISWAKTFGIRHYDLGGALWRSDKDSFLYGVHAFKERWGGELHVCNSFALNKFYVVGRQLFFNNPKIRQLYYCLERVGMIKRTDRG